MSLLNRKSFPSGPFSVFFSPGGGDSHWKTFLYQPSFNWNEEERGENWQKMFEPKISVEPNRAPKHRSNKKRVHCCSVVAGISIRSRKKFRKRTKNGTNPSDPWFQKFRLVLASIALSKLATWLLIRMVSHLVPFFFRPGNLAEHQRLSFGFKLEPSQGRQTCFLMSFHPPLLTIQSLLHPRFEPTINAFSYDNLQPPLRS